MKLRKTSYSEVQGKCRPVYLLIDGNDTADVVMQRCAVFQVLRNFLLFIRSTL